MASPISANAWSLMRSEGQRLLTSLPARSLDLEGLWRAAKQRGKSFLVTPTHVAYWLFGLGGKWGKSRVQAFKFEDSYSYRPKNSERVAAALLLASESHRFKRVVSTRKRSGSADELESPRDEAVRVELGGFKAVDASVVASSQMLSFVSAAKAYKEAKAQTKGQSKAMELTDPEHLVMVHNLELLSLGGDSAALSSGARKSLEALGVPPEPESVQALLVDLGLWSESSSVKNGAARQELVPWSEDVLQAAALLRKTRVKREKTYSKAPSPLVDRVGRPAPFGRVDYRGAPFGFFCIDAQGTAFVDDAISFDASRCELLIHVVDVQGQVKQGSLLDQAAMLRVASQYLPQGPLFMLPPAALQVLSFSNQYLNEAVTLAFRINRSTGQVESCRAMQTLLPPASLLSYSEANNLLEGGADSGRGAASQTIICFSPVAKELLIIEKVVAAATKGKRTPFNPSPSPPTPLSTESTGLSHTLVDLALAMYSMWSAKLCMDAGLPLPVLAGLEKIKFAEVLPRLDRFATGPLRRYVDLLAQRQLVASATGKNHLSRRQIGDAVHYLTTAKNRSRREADETNARLMLESLAAHCARQMKATGATFAVVPGTATGRGREVMVDGLGVLVIAKQPKGPGGGGGRDFKRGAPVQVKIGKVETRGKAALQVEEHILGKVKEGEGR
ncbi:unnamed protein product [Chrysoparadoxa australica]